MVHEDFSYIIDTAVVNAFILYKEAKGRKKITQKEFRLLLADKMIGTDSFWGQLVHAQQTKPGGTAAATF